MRSHALLLEEVRSLRRRLLKPSVAWSFGREGPAACPSREEASQQAPPPPFDSALKWPRLRRPHRLPCLSYHLAVEGVEEAPFESAFLAGQFINSLFGIPTRFLGILLPPSPRFPILFFFNLSLGLVPKAAYNLNRPETPVATSADSGAPPLCFSGGDCVRLGPLS